MRRGWAAARARPWNDQAPTVAALRLERGGDRFLAAACEWLFGQGVGRVLTPALASNQTPVWRRAGFHEHLELTVLERSLATPIPTPARTPTTWDDPDLERLAAVDDRAFDATWRVGREGLADAVVATASSVTLVVEEETAVAGFAIAGESMGVSYLQRLAVDPDRSGRGAGRSLVRAALGWARLRGARTMLLNTQPENETATRLYLSEGFEPLPSRLRVLSRTPEGTP